MARPGLTVGRLAAAGADIADREGFDQVTVSAVARHFDVAVASLYSHVKSSQDLKTQIALLSLTELADRVSADLAGRAAKDALAAFANAYRDYAHEHPGRWVASQFRLDSETAATSAGVRHAQMTRAILRGYHLEGDDQTHAVRLMGSVFHGFITLEMGGGFSHSLPASQESWTRTIDALDSLLRNWPAPSEH